MANREEGAAAPNQRQGQNQQQEQQQNQDAEGQQHIHINWLNFKPEFSGNARGRCRGTFITFQ